MKRLLHGLMCAIFSFLFWPGQSAFGQILQDTVETGFVVVTPVQGTGVGLSVSESFNQVVDGNVFRASVLPTPLVTLTSLVVRTDPSATVDTGVAVVNPNTGIATVRLTLNNEQGDTVAVRIFTIPGTQQVSRFVTELFLGVGELSTAPFSGLLFINADIPVGVMGLTFTGPSFTSLPVAAQLIESNAPPTATGATPPPPPTGTAGSAGTFNTAAGVVVSPFQTTFVVTTTGTPIASLTPPVPFFPQPTPILPTPVFAQPITIPTIPQTSVASVGTLQSQPTMTFSTPIIPLTGPSAPLVNNIGTLSSPLAVPPPQTNFTVATPVVVTPLPELALGVGGQLAALLPQVAEGGGWVSTISIANNSNDTQIVRIDFFNPQGGPLVLPFGSSSIAGLVIPAGGVITVSTNQRTLEGLPLIR